MIAKHRIGLNRAAVIEAAAALINAEGVEALSLGRLAEILGVQPPSLYNHIDGLPGLYRGLARLNASRLGERLAEAALGRSGGDAMRATAQAYRTYIKENPGLYLVSLRASGAQAAEDEELKATEERVVRVALAVVASFGLEGADALHAVRGLRSLVHGFATLELAGGFGLPLDLDESFRRMVELLIRGLQPVD
ncbi:MAG: WHG domain-containing protein [Anaerolineaceae bacterium]|nr:WHG domain-containing protein [Anaerolineaceae bacterium]